MNEILAMAGAAEGAAANELHVGWLWLLFCVTASVAALWVPLVAWSGVLRFVSTIAMLLFCLLFQPWLALRPMPYDVDPDVVHWNREDQVLAIAWVFVVIILIAAWILLTRKRRGKSWGNIGSLKAIVSLMSSYPPSEKD